MLVRTNQPASDDSGGEPVVPQPPVLAGASFPDSPKSTGLTLGIALGWLLGVLVLAGLVTFVLHFSDIEVFIDKLWRADPLWLAAAALCQAATYLCASGVWWGVLRRAGERRWFFGLLELALVQLFVNQAVPSGGVSGTLMVVRGLQRRGIPAPIAMTALLVAALSYYAAYFMVALLAFIVLWDMGDLGTAWKSLSIAFFTVIISLGVAILALTRSRGRFIPKFVLAWRPAAWLADILKKVHIDMLRDGRVVFEAVAFQLAVFLLDVVTLWCVARAVGMTLGPAGVFVSFVLASVVATLSPVPLGLGTFEGTCTAMLHLMGGGVEGSLAATLLLRGFTLWLPMLPGLWMIRREGRQGIQPEPFK
ncbi:MULTISPECIES: lysylphosphatidylglycerol synthase transmembrane domain-containing protein [Mesorhizobium]|uniref:lysylphosphatidylglycerol synthase transmembrane domain-containing protein n=1 Tax=Mesorhizobium TaxID=68287 RepID=UPI0023E7AEAC|nr:lysylphosphatidylglycerol synthase transmembrane domain-containing protein [Mesorhizobium jarvisii]